MTQHERTAEEFFVQHFAALCRCVLVEPHSDHREEIVKNLKASMLFEEIEEASSLVNMARQLQTREYDACIFGPSLDLASVVNFAEKQRDFVCSRDCAFIAVDSGQYVKALLRRKGEALHCTIGWPCSKRAFFEGTVKGILHANEGTVWPGVKLDGEGEIVIEQGGIWTRLTDSPRAARTAGSSMADLGRMLAQLIQGDARTEASGTVERFVNYVSLPEGERTAEDPLAPFFDECIREWQTEIGVLSPREAAKNLRRRLFSVTES